MSDDLRMALLGKRGLLMEEQERLKEEIKTASAAITRELILNDDPERMQIRNIEVNMQVLREHVLKYRQLAAEIQEINEKLGN